MKRRSLFAALALVWFTVAAADCQPTGMRPVANRMYGVTVDNVNGIGTGKLDTVRSSIVALDTANLPTTRIVFDEGEPPAGYTRAVDTLQPVSYLLGELLDSSALADISTPAYVARTKQYLDAFGSKVDAWEVGNEIGGKWAGSNQSQADKVAGAFDAVEARGKRSALTLWYNVGCQDRGELTPIGFTNTFVPDRVKTGLEYLFVSYYEVPCGNRRPSAATWRTLFEQLHTRYPHARVGFGEIGLETTVGNDATLIADAQSIATYYYRLPLWDLPYYGGFHGWWYFQEDAVPSSKPMHATLRNAMH